MRIVVDEGQDLALRHGNCSISSSCGITIRLDDVSYAGPRQRRLPAAAAETTINSNGNGASCCSTDAMARSASPPMRSTGMITETFGLRIEIEIERRRSPYSILNLNHSIEQDMKLIVQIPAFNEEATIAQTLARPSEEDRRHHLDRDAGHRRRLHRQDRRRRAQGRRDARPAAQDAPRPRRRLRGRHRRRAPPRRGRHRQHRRRQSVHRRRHRPKLVAPIVRARRKSSSAIARSPSRRTCRRSSGSCSASAAGRSAWPRASASATSPAASARSRARRRCRSTSSIPSPTRWRRSSRPATATSACRASPVRTNAPTRPSRLYRGIGTYLRKSMATIFRIYTIYRPLKTFFAIGAVLMLVGVALGARFLWFFAQGERGGHIQSLILAAVFSSSAFRPADRAARRSDRRQSAAQRGSARARKANGDASRRSAARSRNARHASRAARRRLPCRNANAPKTERRHRRNGSGCSTKRSCRTAAPSPNPSPSPISTTTCRNSLPRPPAPAVAVAAAADRVPGSSETPTT